MSRSRPLFTIRPYCSMDWFLRRPRRRAHSLGRGSCDSKHRARERQRQHCGPRREAGHRGVPREPPSQHGSERGVRDSEVGTNVRARILRQKARDDWNHRSEVKGERRPMTRRAGSRAGVGGQSHGVRCAARVPPPALRCGRPPRAAAPDRRHYGISPVSPVWSTPRFVFLEKRAFIF